MNNFLRRMAVLGLPLLALMQAPAQADDTEIYTLAPAASTIGGADTNIIFMLDNSGSMKFCLDTSSGCTTDSNSRIYALRKSMDTILGKLDSKTKVALFTYGNKYGSTGGGTMLAPLKSLDSTLTYGKSQREFLLDWFVDVTKTGDNRYSSSNVPYNWRFNYGKTSSSNPDLTATNTYQTYHYNDGETNMDPLQSTPLNVAYAEVALYILGKEASDYGVTNFSTAGVLRKVDYQTWSCGYSCTRSYWSNPTESRSYGAATVTKKSDNKYYYTTPFDPSATGQCVKPSWHIILLTDGEPTSNNGKESFSRVLSSVSSTTNAQLPASRKCDTNNFGDGWECSQQTARFLMNAKDYAPDTYSWQCTGSNPAGGDCSRTTVPAGTCSAGTAGASQSSSSYTQLVTTSYSDVYTCSQVSTPTTSYAWACETPGFGSTCVATAPTTTCNASNAGTTPVDRSYSRTITDIWTCTRPATGYKWECTTKGNGTTCGSTAPASSGCNSTGEIGNTSSRNYSLTVNDKYACKSSVTNVISYDWKCTTTGVGNNCEFSTKPTNTCGSSQVGTTRSRTYNHSEYKTFTNTYTCNKTATGWNVSYDNNLRTSSGEQVEIHTHAIFLGKDAYLADKVTMTDAAKSLKAVADAGSGSFSVAGSTDDLVKQFSSIVKQATSDAGTISAPGVAVNQMNRFLHLDQLYYAVFKPSTKKMWTGNLKRYWLKYDINSKTDFISDALGNNAVNATSKFFEKSSSSCWGDGSGKQVAGCQGKTGDGDNVAIGGAIAGLDATDILTRKVFTTLSTVAPSQTGTTAMTQLTTGMTAAGYASHFGMPSATSTDETNFSSLIRWMLGQDAATPPESNGFMGDPLHSQPVLVNYGFTGDNLSGDALEDAREASQNDGSLQKNYVFVGTNAGYLHALDAYTGAEKFSFVPYELLPMMKNVKDPADWVSGESRVYGLDAPWTPWRRDGNGDGKISTGTSGANADWVYLYGGMRMGGSGIYALDITDLSAPAMKWTIQGALDGGFTSNTSSVYSGVPMPAAKLPANTSPYRFMGQSWSQPVLARIAWGSTNQLDASGNVVKDASGNNVQIDSARTVLVFGGGYDPFAETANTSGIAAHSYGHQIYIVDAKTGELLFWASGQNGVAGSVAEATPTLKVTDMTYSITGSVVPIDRGGDGIADMLYFADLGGQVWRMDLSNRGTNDLDSSGKAQGNTCAAAPCSGLVLGVRKLASVGEKNYGTTGGLATQRRFFESPTVAFMQKTTGSVFVALGLASGNRSHPRAVSTSTAQDRIYFMIDKTALNASLASPTVTAYIDNGTAANSLPDMTTYNYATAATINNGYYINLDNTLGEKAFSTPLVFQTKMYLTTYVPDTATTVTADNQCKPATGKSRLYAFSAFDGKPLASTAGPVNSSDRYTDNITASITGDPQLMFRPGGGTTIVTGTKATDGDDLVGKGVRRTRWYEKSKQ